MKCLRVKTHIIQIYMKGSNLLALCCKHGDSCGELARASLARYNYPEKQVQFHHLHSRSGQPVVKGGHFQMQRYFPGKPGRQAPAECC